jgi:hypothetical protein
MQLLSEAAEKSGWSLTQQIRYELSVTRGLWKPIQPYLPRAQEMSQE